MSDGTGRTVVVTPVFEDRKASSVLFARLRQQLGEGVFIAAVDDGSVRDPLQACMLSDAGAEGVLITLRRNVGHQRAIATGLNWVAEHLPMAGRIVVMDSDGEDLPESIRELAGQLGDEVDVVVARRRNRADTMQFKLFYLVYRLLFRLLSGRRISFGNFMVMNRRALVRLVAMQELWIHLAGSVLVSRLTVEMLSMDRGPRYAGDSKMNFVGLALHGFRALMVFAEDVLVRVGIACTGVAALSIVGGIAAVTLKLLGIATPGWFSVALGILVLVFLQTGAVTLMTLMLTGVVRGGSVAKVDYREFIRDVTHVRALVSTGSAMGRAPL